MAIGLPVWTISLDYKIGYSATSLYKNTNGQIITNFQLSISMASLHSIPSTTDEVSIVDWSVDGAVFYMHDLEVLYFYHSF